MRHNMMRCHANAHALQCKWVALQSVHELHFINYCIAMQCSAMQCNAMQCKTIQRSAMDMPCKAARARMHVCMHACMHVCKHGCVYACNVMLCNALQCDVKPCSVM